MSRSAEKRPAAQVMNERKEMIMAETPKYKDESLSFRERAEDLVSRMTVEECASQMLFEAAKVERLGIPSYNWWNEALHGTARSGMATVFPQAIGLAATFDSELVGKAAEVAAEEGRAKYNVCQKYGDHGIYKGLTFWSPNVNIFRDPRWGRGQETYGEDPWLTGKLGKAFVQGLQGDDPHYLKSAACAKHFAAHSGPESKRHEFNAVASRQDMAETYLPAFQELCEAGVEGFMGAYNRTNGEPCCGSKTLLVDLLRGEWGFDGYVTSDCWAISDFHLQHHVTDTATQSVALALKNGCDLNCGNLYGHLLAALEEGLITEEMIRRSTVRLMTTRMKLGMFDQHTPFDNISYDVVDCDLHRALNYELACRSLVLLKNDGILPLDQSKLKNVAVIGPNAASVTALLGNYHGTPNQAWTVLEGVRSLLPEDVRLNYSKGCHLYENKLEDPGYSGDCLSEVKIQCELADAVILVVGLDETIEGEEMKGHCGGDKPNLLLPEPQRLLLKAVCETGKPFILVNLTGSSIDFGCANEGASAIIQGWYPGAMGGKAIADLIFGKFSPSGRLPVTFYRNDNHLPDFEDYSMENRTYKFFREEPLFPFGYGLSYTRFAYEGIQVSQQEIHPEEGLTARVTLRNTGDRDGEEVVQLYVRDEEASTRVPRHKLCGMRRVAVKAGQSVTVEIDVEAAAFSLVDEEGRLRWEPGAFTLFAGGCQPDEQSQRLSGSRCVSARVLLTEE